MADEVSADTDHLGEFVDRGRSFVFALVGIEQDLARRRSMVARALGDPSIPSAVSALTELTDRAVINNEYVGSIRDTLQAWDLDSDPKVTLDGSIVDLGLQEAGFGPDIVAVTGAGALASLKAAAAADGNAVFDASLDIRLERAGLSEDWADVTPLMLEKLRSGELTGQEVRELIRQHTKWELIAAERAGIDLLAWKPEAGVSANAETIEAVYEYYGDLYQENQAMEWAGMANAVGPSFAAGFHDLEMFRNAAKKVEGATDLPVDIYPVSVMNEIASLSDAELAFYETTFLAMQKEIFLDQAPMHEAYRAGGLDAIEEMRQNGEIPPEMVDAWKQIDEGSKTGNQQKIEDGNLKLLVREQKHIIENEYQAMYSRPASGKPMTYLMTALGEPSIPGARSYAEVYPWTPDWDSPGWERLKGDWGFQLDIPMTNRHLFGSYDLDNPVQGRFYLETPLPDGNVANFDDRWRLIENDTLPSYQALSREEKLTLASADVGQRIDDSRLGPEDAVKFFHGWNPGFEQ